MTVVEGWKECKVRDICEIGRGRVISGQEIERNPGVFPVYSSQSFNNGKMGSIDTFDFDGEYVTWTTDGAYAGTVFYRSGQFNCTNVCGTLRAKDQQVCMSFLAYKLSTLAKDYVSYVGNPKIMNGVMAGIEFSIPTSKPEQTKIAEILSTVDRAIEQTDALISKQQRIKTGLMQDLLTRGIDEHGNLRSEQTHQFKDSPLGRIPMEWEITQIRNAASLQRGHDITENELCAGPYPVISSSGIIGYHCQCTSNGPNVVVGRKGTIGKVHYLENSFWAHDTSLYVTNFYENSEKFVYYLFCHLDLARYGTKSGSPSLNRNDIHPLWVGLPKPIEQVCIANILMKSDHQENSLVSNLEKAKQLKIALMQDLLTGKKRVLAL